MKATNISQADNIGKVGRLREDQNRLQAKQNTQKAAVAELAQASADMRDPGTTDNHAAVVTNIDETMINAVNLSRDTEARAIEVMNEKRANATTADGHARNAQHNAKVISNVSPAMNDVLSGKQARAIGISIAHEDEHQTNIRDTSNQNAAELEAHTNEAVAFTHEMKRKVNNIITPN